MENYIMHCLSIKCIINSYKKFIDARLFMTLCSNQIQKLVLMFWSVCSSVKNVIQNSTLIKTEAIRNIPKSIRTTETMHKSILGMYYWPFWNCYYENLQCVLGIQENDLPSRISISSCNLGRHTKCMRDLSLSCPEFSKGLGDWHWFHSPSQQLTRF